ncbi:MAG: HesA/MoeB/ThiF family protein [Candidatus Helarchaeota archaeon]|nr:HesA/MoeB/ThiF family protein [Candidatus Helarchaeota archaeon]
MKSTTGNLESDGGTEPQTVLERYNRQMRLKEWNQEKLLSSTVFIAGVGALGSVIALNLAMMGVGHLVLCDFDTIELSNLARQVLFKNEDIGKSKVLTAKTALEGINPTIKITALNQKLETIDQKVFEQCDAIADGLDTFEARRWLNSVAVTLKKPLIHGGMFGWMGNVQVVIPFKTPCLECHPLIPQERLQKPCTPPGEARKEQEKAPEEEQKIPTLATVSTVIGGIQSQEVIKVLLNSDNILNGFLFYDAKSETLTNVELIQNQNCIVCGKYRIEGVNFAIDEEDTIRDVKNRLIMAWGLQEPMRLAIRGIIQEDATKLKGLHLKEKEPIFVWDKTPSKPLKLYAILKGKESIPSIALTPPSKEKVVKISPWSKLQESMVDAGKVSIEKNRLQIQAWDTGATIRFFKTLAVSTTQRKIRYKLKQRNSK